MSIVNKENNTSRRSFLGNLTKWIGGTAVLAGVSNILTPKKTFANTETLEPFIGQIILFGGNFAPRGWAFCNGQLLSISQNQSLFSIIGTYYGGDGRTTFGLPDLRGRVPIGVGNGPGLSNYNIGNIGGVENNTLTEENIPPHRHNLNIYSEEGNTDTPMHNYISANPEGMAQFSESSDDVANEFAITTNNSVAQPFTNIQPYTAIHYIIALQGIYPSRS